ncbi:substrate-binding periplasmic protein [Thalassomonas haliotis]|uniref:Transporter substrate-binding domain-containing protein n=1 Tax=Thalassomonas haliotis TaxID=485448 RepID=A0ABY7VAI5_9GAMM|nr:transporter substrate-binding domain-containing protein [Thalassomonas haliotis]WDE10305.1 transporter substrate-binding domain-containing protein [Thalassomonas haliotis]
MLRSVFALSLMLLTSLTSVLAGEKSITVVADDWPPYVDFSHPGKGLCIEVVKAAFKTQGYTLKVIKTSWARAIHGVEHGIYDILPNAWLTRERTKFLLYSQPFTSSRLKFIIRKGESFEYKNLASLDNKVVGIISGSSYGQAFDHANNFQRNEVINMMQNLKMLLAKRIDVMIEDDLGFMATVNNRAPALLRKIAIVEPAFLDKPLHVAVGRNHKRSREIITDFNLGLAQIRNNGVLAEIKKSYGVN